jgi:hypothetical protein
MGELIAYTFSGHETFPFRYPWLKKGYDAVRADGSVFQRDDAITTLGVGKNMVRSIRHWCLAAGLIAEGDRRAEDPRPTALGEWLLDDRTGRDPYLEDPATLWLLHWQIASNPRRATTWYWTFSHFNEPDFTIDHLASAVHRWSQTLPGKEVAFNTVRRDVEVFVHTYVPTRTPRGTTVEDSIDCPLVELDLLKANSDGKSFHFRRGPQEDLPDGVLYYATLQYWDSLEGSPGVLSISDLARQAGSPGRLFKIDESSLIGRYEQAEQLTDGYLGYNETAGLKQLYRDTRQLRRSPVDLLELAYPAANTAGGGVLR